MPIRHIVQHDQFSPTISESITDSPTQKFYYLLSPEKSFMSLFSLIPVSTRIPEPLMVRLDSPATVRVNLTQASAPVEFPSGRVVVRSPGARGDGPTFPFGTDIAVNTGDRLFLFVNGLSNIYGDSEVQQVSASVSGNQVLFDFADGLSSNTYQLTVVVSPR